MAIHPPLLRYGDTIGLVTLGSPLPAAQIDNGIATLKNMGFSVVVGDYVYASNGFLAGTAEQRAADFMKMVANPDVKLILPTRGGVGVAGILPFLDYPAIARNPKIVSGYSDITVLLNVLYQLSDLVTFSGLLLIDFRQQSPPFNFNRFFDMVSSAAVPKSIINPPGIPLVGRVPGRVTARLVGGNLSSLLDTLGTPYEIDTRGKILFLEETHEPVNKVYRMLNHLQLAGKFNDCAGIVMGECTNCPAAYDTSYNDLIEGFIVPLGKPLLTNLSAAHGFYKATVPIGSVVAMDTQSPEPSLTVVEPTVS